MVSIEFTYQSNMDDELPKELRFWLYDTDRHDVEIIDAGVIVTTQPDCVEIESPSQSIEVDRPITKAQFLDALDDISSSDPVFEKSEMVTDGVDKYVVKSYDEGVYTLQKQIILHGQSDLSKPKSEIRATVNDVDYNSFSVSSFDVDEKTGKTEVEQLRAERELSSVKANN